MRNPLALLVVAAAFIGGIYFGLQQQSEPLSLKNATYLVPPRAVAPFSLQATNVAELDNAALRQQWTLLFFGFTNCPDICPTTLQLLANVRNDLSAELTAEELPQIILVTVDPARDDLASLRQYTAYFGDGVEAARGEEDALSSFATDLGILYQQIPLENGDYTMDHSAAVLMLDPDANLRAVFSPPLRQTEITSDIVSIIDRSGS